MASWNDGIFFGFGHKLTDEQKRYLDCVQHKQLVIVNAKSGTGKTTVAVGAAKLRQKPLYYLFNPVEEDSLGYTPGSPFAKESKYFQPLKDALIAIDENPDQVIFNPDAEHRVVNKCAWAHAQSHVFMRGTNLSDSTVIIDEAQNWTIPMLKKALTRIHDDCKVIVMGHLGQIDLPDPSLSGFARLMQHFSDKPYAAFCELTKNFRGVLATHSDEL